MSMSVADYQSAARAALAMDEQGSRVRADTDPEVLRIRVRQLREALEHIARGEFRGPQGFQGAR